MEHIEVVDVHDLDAATKLYDELTVHGIVSFSAHMAHERRYRMSHQETAAILADPETMAAIEEGEQHVRNGLVTEL